MSQTVAVGGTNYTIPDQGDPPNWGTNLTPFFVALAAELATSPAFVQIVVANSSPVTVATEKTYLVASNSLAVTMNLPTPVQNIWFTVKDSGFNAASNNITIHRHGTEKINGVASDKTLTISGGYWLFACDGTDWYMFRDPEAIKGLNATNQIVINQSNGAISTTLSMPVPASSRIYTFPDVSADANVILSQGTQTIAGAKTFSSAIAITATSNHIVLSTISNTLTIQADTQTTSGRTWTIPDVFGPGTFAALQGAQTFSGTKTFSAAPIISALTASTVPYLDASKVLTSSAVTPTELGYLSGVSSAVQTQMNLKAPLASPTFTGTVVIPTPFTLGAISVTATGTELNYSVGVTSAIQTQLGTKAPTASPTFTGVVAMAAGSAGAPSLHFGDTGSGFYKPGTNTIAVTTSGTVKTAWDVDYYPVTDNSMQNGVTGQRWKSVWAVNGTIQTSMSSTKTNIREMAATDCKIPKAIYFNRPTDESAAQQLGFAADNLPDEAHPVINPKTGERSSEDVYTSAVIGMLCQAARNDFDRLATIEAKLSDLIAKKGGN